MASSTHRACDACRMRKVKCNGTSPCTQCAHLNLRCVFSPSSKRRKRIVRGSRVAQLRGNVASKILDPVVLLPSEPETEPSTNGHLKPDCDTAELNAAPIVAQANYSSDFFIGLLSEFEQAVYPVNPVITIGELREAISNMNDNYQDKALVYAFAAVTVNLTTTTWASHDDLAALMTDLIEGGIQAHRRVEWEDGLTRDLPLSVKRAVTCVFIGAALTAFKLFGRSFAMLREAIAIVCLLDAEQPSSDGADLDASEIARRQRLSWEIYIHERFLLLVAGFPISLPALSTSIPFTDSTIPPYVETGFNCLIRLFCIVDDTFLTHWSAYQQGGLVQTPPATMAEWIESKQAELDHDEICTAEAEQALQGSGGGVLTALQHADLFITRLWLRTLVWQLALSHGLLRSTLPCDRHDGLSLHFPARRISGQMRGLIARLDSFACIGTHGNGILQKLFEITSTVADVLALPLNGQTQDIATGQVEDVMFTVRFLLRFKRAYKCEKDHLLEKVEILQRIYTNVDFSNLDTAS